MPNRPVKSNEMVPENDSNVQNELVQFLKNFDRKESFTERELVRIAWSKFGTEQTAQLLVLRFGIDPEIARRLAVDERAAFEQPTEESRAIEQAEIEEGASYFDVVPQKSESEDPDLALAFDGLSINVDIDLRDDEVANENTLAIKFVTYFKDWIRYVPAWKTWVVWDGRRWAVDIDKVRVTRLARYFTKRLFNCLLACRDLDTKRFTAIAKFVHTTNRNSAINNIVALARTDARVTIDYTAFDSDPLLLNCENGTLNLKTRELHPFRRGDYITMISKFVFDPAAKCPRIERAFKLIFQQPGLYDYVIRLSAYSITGLTGEAILPVCYGEGRNGKSTHWNLQVHLMGDYGLLAADSLILKVAGNTHPTELASLYRKRFVTCSEPEENSFFNESRIKQLTGDSLISCRRMKEDFWEFERTHKTWIATNHLPTVKGTDEAIWSRLKVIPFEFHIPSLIKKINQALGENYLPETKEYWRELTEENSGYLNLLLDGLKAYFEKGFEEPACVKLATDEYRAKQNEVGQWAEDRLEADAGAETLFHAAYQDYLLCHLDRRKAVSQKKFSQDLSRIYTSTTPTNGEHRNKVVFKGCKLKRVVQS